MGWYSAGEIFQRLRALLQFILLVEDFHRK